MHIILTFLPIFLYMLFNSSETIKKNTSFYSVQLLKMKKKRTFYKGNIKQVIAGKLPIDLIKREHSKCSGLYNI